MSTRQVQRPDRAPSYIVADLLEQSLLDGGSDGLVQGIANELGYPAAAAGAYVEFVYAVGHHRAFAGSDIEDALDNPPLHCVMGIGKRAGSGRR